MSARETSEPLAGPAVAVVHLLRDLTKAEAAILADRLSLIACEMLKGEHQTAKRLWLSVTLVEDDGC